MEPDISARLSALEQKVDTMVVSLKRIQNYFLWTGIITVALFVLPLIGLIFAIPSFLKSYSSLDSIDSTTSTINSLNSLTQ